MSVSKELLKMRDIDDGVEFLEEIEGRENIGFTDRAQIAARGSVHLMLRRTVTRKAVDERFAKLKYV